MKDKIFKSIFSVLFILIVAMAGLLIGTTMEQGRVAKENKRDTIRNIAIVNLDEGIYEKDEKIIYAEELLQFPDDNFYMTGLEDARKGIMEGRFAAYIILPSEFSRNVESINEMPQKTLLKYELNPNLRGDISASTIDDIRNFEMLLNVNMSYMYLDAILKEFHEVQDSTKIIMKNDNMDLNSLNTISAMDLIVNPEFTEIKPIENKVLPLNLRDVYEKNNKVVDNVQKTYEDSITKGKEQISEIKEQSDVVENVMKEMQGTFDNINFENDEEGNSILEKGVKEIKEVILGEKKKQDNAKNNIVSKLSGGTVSGPQITRKVTLSGNSLSSNAIENKVKSELQDIKDYVKQEEESYNQELSVEKDNLKEKITDLESKGTVSANDITQISNIINNIKDININLDDKNIDLTNELKEQRDGIKKEISNEIINDLNDFPVIEGTLFDKIINEEIMEPLKNECQAEGGKFNSVAEKMNLEMNTYQTSMEKFDPYEFLDEGSINTSMSQFSENIIEMESNMEKKLAEDNEVLSENYIVANEAIYDMSEVLQNSYLETEENIAGAVESAKKQRTSSNEVNIQLLESFSQKLPYTRLGTMEYEQAYDFIANPIKMENAGNEIEFKVVSMGEPRGMKIVLLILIGMMMLTLLINIALNAIQGRKERRMFYIDNN